MRYPLLDSLRGVAAVWVFLHHLVYAFDGTAAPWLLRLGYFGVPMFFVISGYCLTAAGRRAVQTRETPERFLFRRVLRIYPPFWGAVVVAVGVYALVPLTGKSVSVFEETLRGPWRLIEADDWLEILTLTAGIFSAGDLPWNEFRPVNLAFWTLAIEVQFYAVVWLAVRAGRWFYPVLVAVTMVSLPFLPSGAAFRSGWFLPFWPFFALGIGLYAALERGGPAESLLGDGRHGSVGRWVILIAGTALAAWGLTVAPLMPDGSRAMMAGEFAFAAGLTAMLWVGWRPAGEKRAVSPVGRVFGYLGAVSYSVYLLHIPLMILVAHAVALVFTPGSFGFDAVTVVTVCALVYPFYRWVERPCMTSGRARRADPPSPPAFAQDGSCSLPGYSANYDDPAEARACPPSPIRD